MNLMPVAREPIQLFFMIVSLICDFSMHFTPKVFKVTQTVFHRMSAQVLISNFSQEEGRLSERGRLIEEVGGGRAY